MVVELMAEFIVRPFSNGFPTFARLGRPQKAQTSIKVAFGRPEWPQRSDSFMWFLEQRSNVLITMIQAWPDDIRTIDELGDGDTNKRRENRQNVKIGVVWQEIHEDPGKSKETPGKS